MPLIEMPSTREENPVILYLLSADPIAFVTFDGRATVGSPVELFAVATVGLFVDPRRVMEATRLRNPQ